MPRRNPVALLAAVILAALACLAPLAPAHALGLAYAPKRIALPAFVDDLVQCNIRIAPEAVLGAHARYCEAFRAAFALVDAARPSNSANSALELGDTYPTVKGVRKSVQEAKVALAQTISLADAFLDELQRSVLESEVAAFGKFRDECHIRLLMEQIGAAGDTYRLHTPQDLGGWIRVAVDARGRSADERSAIAAARLARSTERRTALRELLQAVDEARLREATRAEELGIGGMTREAATEKMHLARRASEGREGEWFNDMDQAGRIALQARTRITAVELDAWHAAAPLLPASARRYAASTFLEVLAGGGSGVGNSGGLPPELSRVHYGGGIDLVRIALSLPGLTAEQKQALREACAEWLDARTAEFERLGAASARAEFSGEPDSTGMNRIDREHRHTIAALAKTEWLEADPQNDGGAQQHMPNSRPVANLPAREDLSLDPEDDARFPLPRGGSSWYAGSERSIDDWSARSEGTPPALPPIVDADAEQTLATTEDQRLVIRTICADFRNEWNAVIPPLAATAKKESEAARLAEGRATDAAGQAAVFARKLELARKGAASRAALWAATNTSLRSLGEQLSAALPTDRKNVARVWAQQQQLWVVLPRPGWALSMPNLPAAAFLPWLSREGQRIIVNALVTSADAVLAKADEGRAWMHKADFVDPAFLFEFDERGMARPGDAPFDRLHQHAEAARDAYLAFCKDDADRIASALNERDAAAWRIAVDAQRTPFAYVSLKDVMQALEDTPQNQAARAVVAAENEPLDALCTQAFAILSQLPEAEVRLHGDLRGPNTELHLRAAVYTDLAKDLRTQALWRLRPKMPLEVVERVAIFRQASAIDALGGIAP